MMLDRSGLFVARIYVNKYTCTHNGKCWTVVTIFRIIKTDGSAFIKFFVKGVIV